jgi:fido (protein-threonine AMPylation protein)
VLEDREFMELLYRGGILMSFTQVTKTDYRAIAFSQDHVLYQSDSYHDLDTWREILELANIEDWEIEQALAKIDDDII